MAKFWRDPKVETPEERRQLILVEDEEIVSLGFYINKGYWTSIGRVMRINPTKWGYVSDLLNSVE